MKLPLAGQRIDVDAQPHHIGISYEFRKNGVRIFGPSCPRLVNEGREISKGQFEAPFVFIVGEVQSHDRRHESHALSMPDHGTNLWDANG